MVRLFLPCFVGAILAGVGTLSHAERVTFEYFGQTTSVSQAPALFPNVQAGDDFSFIFTFDTTATNSATQESDEFTRGNFSGIEAVRLTFGDEQAEPVITDSEIVITDRPGSGRDFFQVSVEFDNDEVFFIELEDGPGLDSADLPTSPPAVADFGPDNGGEYFANLADFSVVDLLQVNVLGERQLDPDFLLVGGSTPPDQTDGGGMGDMGMDDMGMGDGGGNGGGNPVTVIPTPAAAVMGLPLLLGIAVRRGARSQKD
ncbi:MAG: hypothetical protein AAF086_07210 [Planctomycetota bacterium]